MNTRIKVWGVNEAGNGQDVTITIVYDSKRDEFYTRIPAFLCADPNWSQTSGEEVVFSEGTLTGPSPRTVKDAYEKLCSDYTEAMKKVRKVIAYNVATDLEGRWGADGLSIKFKWEVLNEIVLGEKKSYRIFRSDNFYCGDTTNIIEWSEEAEKFFQQIEQGFGSLSERLHAFLDKPSDVVSLIHSGNRLIELK